MSSCSGRARSLQLETEWLFAYIHKWYLHNISYGGRTSYRRSPKPVLGNQYTWLRMGKRSKMEWLPAWICPGCVAVACWKAVFLSGELNFTAFRSVPSLFLSFGLFSFSFRFLFARYTGFHLAGPLHFCRIHYWRSGRVSRSFRPRGICAFNVSGLPVVPKSLLYIL